MRFAATFRLVTKRSMSSATVQVRSTAASGSQVYESKRAVDEYLLFHYGRPEDILSFPKGPVEALKFPARCAKICSEHSAKDGRKRALDIGCAVGASSFELARAYEEVVGIDFSNHFVDAANTMKAHGKMQFESLVRGHVFRTCETNMDQSIDRTRVTFQQGDACNLSPALGKSVSIHLCLRARSCYLTFLLLFAELHQASLTPSWHQTCSAACRARASSSPRRHPSSAPAAALC
jgi:SAM-dependent methyltransferase